MDLILSMVITWTIGLTPPLLTRYIVVRGPLSKWPAVGVCALLFFVNMIIFISLGSQSKTHSVLYVIAFASYWLLRRPSQQTTVPKVP